MLLLKIVDGSGKTIDEVLMVVPDEYDVETVVGRAAEMDIPDPIITVEAELSHREGRLEFDDYRPYVG